MMDDDIAFMRRAIDEARKSRAEDDRTHPRVGVVVVRDGEVLATAHRGEIAEGDHAEYTALEKKLSTNSVVGATVYTTLEPCTNRHHPKVPCADRLIERKVRRVVIGMLDPNPQICGRGLWLLRESNVATDLFPHALMCEVEELNREFVRTHRGRTYDPPSATLARTSDATAPQQPLRPPAVALPTDNNDPNAMFSQLLEAMEATSLQEAEKHYEQLLQHPDGNKDLVTVVYFDFLYRATGRESARRKLREMVDNSDVADLAAAKLAEFAALAYDYNAAAAGYLEASRRASSPDAAVLWLIEHAKCLQKMGNSSDAKVALVDFLRTTDTNAFSARALALDALATVFEARSETGIKAAIRARAAQLVPADRHRRFDAAYALSEADVSHLALAHYDALLSLAPENAGALNNIAVECQGLNIMTRAIDYFKRAMDLGNTLAAANLADRYITGGFVKEAEEILQAAQKQSDVHANVGGSMTMLRSKRREDDEAWKNTLEAGAREQTFLTEFVAALLTPFSPEAPTGPWYLPDGRTTTLVVNGNTAVGEWGERFDKGRITLQIEGLAATATIEKWEVFRDGFGSPVTGYAFLKYLVGTDPELHIMTIESRDVRFVSWKRVAGAAV